MNAAHLRAIRLDLTESAAKRAQKRQGDGAADGSSSSSANELLLLPSAINPQPPLCWSVPSFNQRLMSVIPSNLTQFLLNTSVLKGRSKQVR